MDEGDILVDRTWMSVKMPFGKHMGDTLGMIRSNDQSYLFWLANELKKPSIRESDKVLKVEVDKAIAYINTIDPWSK